MNKIPVEIIEEFTKYLDLATLVKFRSCCKFTWQNGIFAVNNCYPDPDSTFLKAVLGSKMHHLKYLLNYKQVSEDKLHSGFKLACMEGRVHVVRLLLPLIKNHDNCLHLAAEKDYLQICKLLVEFGWLADSINVEGQTPLHVAAEKNHFDICEWLVNVAGCNLYTKDHSGRTPASYFNYRT